MTKINEEKLESIKGGNIKVTAPLIQTIYDVANFIKDLGYTLGSGIRRITEGNLCPLK